MKFRVGKLLTTIGGAVGILAAIAMAIKLKATITPGVEQVLVYRELFITSAVLLVVGAFVGRRETEMKRSDETRAKELGGPSEPPMVNIDRESEREQR